VVLAHIATVPLFTDTIQSFMSSDTSRVWKLSRDLETDSVLNQRTPQLGDR